jgi:hypothetical protein
MTDNEIYKSFEVELPDILKYAEYHGSFNKMIMKAYEKDNKSFFLSYDQVKSAKVKVSFK